MSDPRPDIWRRYSRLTTTLTLAILAVLGIALVAIGVIIQLPQRWEVVTDSVGTSLLASVVVYALVSLFLEPPRQEVQVRSAVDYTTQVVFDMFRSKFELLLPKATYDASDALKTNFRKSFVTLISSSTRYHLKATSANFTTFRLDTLQRNSKMRSLDIRLCLLNPKAGPRLQAHARHQLTERGLTSDAGVVANEINRIRDDLFVSVVALFDIRDSLPTSVYFHDDLPFFRCEIFDHGMFLTYYLGSESRPGSYPATLEFASTAQPFRAYKYSVDVTMEYSPLLLQFGSVGPYKNRVETEDDLIEHLNGLGCTLSTDELRAKKVQRFERLRQAQAHLRLAPNELF